MSSGKRGRDFTWKAFKVGRDCFHGNKTSEYVTLMHRDEFYGVLEDLNIIFSAKKIVIFVRTITVGLM